jgi:signal transduction histidine kinase/CheY-like chemotaxis protein
MAATFLLAYRTLLRSSERRAGDALAVVLQTSEEALIDWRKDRLVMLQTLASESALRVPALRLLEDYARAEPLSAASLDSLRRYFRNHEELLGRMGFFVIAPDGMSLASSRDSNLSTPNLIEEQRPDLFSALLEGESLFVPPIVSDVLLRGTAKVREQAKPPTMFFAVPLREQGAVVGILAIRVDPTDRFTQVLSRGWIGEYGEVYAVDREGTLLSVSRGEKKLREAGILGEEEGSILSVRATAGWADGNASLSRAAAAVTQGRAGEDLKGYPNYLNEQVVGAWQWSEQLGFGLITELPLSVVLRGPMLAGRILMVLFFVILAASVSFTFITLRLSDARNRALRETNALLSREVKTREDEVREGQEQYHLAVESSSDLIALIDLKSLTLLTANGALRTILGWTDGQTVSGVTLRSISADPQQGGKPLEEALEELRWEIETSQHVHREWLLHHVEGVSVPLLLSATRLAPPRDNRAVLVGQDIAPLIRVQDELEEARRAAELASRAKGLFLTSMSHEIRSPMNVILGYTQLLRRDQNLTAEQRRILEVVATSGEHLLALLNDVLEMSRIEAGRLELRLSNLPLWQTLENLHSMFRVKAEPKGVTVLLEMAEDLPRHVKTDGTRLRQILINLLSNAVKFVSAGEIRLRASVVSSLGTATPRLGSGPLSVVLRFDVIDTGQGVPDEVRERIFQEFEQAEKNHQGGIGLGLALSRNFARAMGGDLELAPTSGQGSHFICTVRVETTEEPVEPKDAAAPRFGPLCEADAGLPALVVDDNEGNRELLRRLLTSQGFEVRIAEGGLRAVELFREWRPPLVLMDIAMPDLDGIQATQRIRQLPGGEQATVIAVTASVFDDDRRRILAGGVDGLLLKPVRENDLFELIENLCGVRFEHLVEVPPAVLDGEGDFSLPADLVASLRRCVEEGAVTDLEDLIEEVKTHSARLAEHLREAAYDFDLTALRTLLSEFEKR